MRIKARFFLLILGLVVYSTYAFSDHITEKLPTKYSPVSPEAMSKRINEAAVQYKEHAPIPRIIQCDIAMPKNLEEFTAMNTFCIIMVTAQCQNKEEIPLSRIYYTYNGKEIDLVGITQYAYEVRDEESTEVFGPWRIDYYCFIPYQFLLAEGTISADFAKNRNGFVFYKTPITEKQSFITNPKQLEYNPDKIIDTDFLKAFLSREFEINLE